MTDFSKDKRFIEETFPVREVSKQGAREKNIRHGHISTLHIWWARRPLATSRATNLAALIPAPKDEKEKREISEFIAEFSKWENSNNPEMIEKARKMILDANNGVPPKVLDPFAGGGSIPLEAMRLGCETYASDYNPVAVLIEKCTLEYPQKYGKPIPYKKYLEERPWLEKKIENEDLFDDDKMVNPLVEDVKYWGNWVLEEAKKEIGRFYPNDPDGSIPVGYIWSRTVPCQNPACGTEIPLFRQYWLAKKPKKKVSLYPFIEESKVKFKIVGDGYEPFPEDFEPTSGSVSRAIVTCPVCGNVIEAKTTRRLFQQGKNSERMVAVVLHKPGETGKKYRLANEQDINIFKQAEAYLQEKREKLKQEWGIDPVPDEPMNKKDSTTIGGRGYGFNNWGELTNSRQKISIIYFSDFFLKIKKNYEETLDLNYFNAMISYLAIAIDKVAVYQTTFGYWHNTRELVNPALGRQAIIMTWDYSEVNIFGGNADWNSGIKWIVKYLIHFQKIPNILNFNDNMINISSATKLNYEDNSFDAVFTDPPYYDNINYAVLSDFFYVWLKRTVGGIYPELFSTLLTPKTIEIVSNLIRHNNKEQSKKFFEENLKKAFLEMYRVLKSNGIVVIVYAHKTTEGWETLVNSLLDSNLVVTAAYPLDTEMMNKVKAHGTASLASSIYIIARKISRINVGFYNNIKEELKQYLNVKLDKLWSEGIGGADFFIAAIGKSIEVFGKYKQVMDVQGNIIRANKLLEDVREIVVDYCIKQILHNGFAKELSLLTKFYILYRFNFGEAKTIFDEAKKLASSLGLDLADEWNKPGFIQKEKSYILILGPDKRETQLKEKKYGTNSEIIDVLHYCLILWSKGRTKDILSLLAQTGYGKKDVFYRVGQAISETLSNESKEKKLLDGFLAGKERIKKEVGSAVVQEVFKF